MQRGSTGRFPDFGVALSLIEAKEDVDEGIGRYLPGHALQSLKENLIKARRKASRAKP